MAKNKEELWRLIHNPDSEMPEIMRTLGLKPPENLGGILADNGLDTKDLTDVVNPADLFNVLTFTAAIDINRGNKDYEVTMQAWDLLAAARERSGPRGLTQGLTGMLERMAINPSTFADYINAMHQVLRHGDNGRV